MADLGNLIATLLGFIAVVVWSIRKLRRDDNDKWLVGVPLLYSLAAVGVASHGVRFSEDSVQSLHYTAIAGSLFCFHSRRCFIRTLLSHSPARTT